MMAKWIGCFLGVVCVVGCDRKTAGVTAAPSASVAASATATATASASAQHTAAIADIVTLKTTPEGDPIGRCPAGWIGNAGGACNRPCKTNADCHPPNKCQTLGATRFCDH